MNCITSKIKQEHTRNCKNYKKSIIFFKTIIQRNVRLSEAPSYGESIIAYDATSKGAVNYINLANEIIKLQVK